MDQETLNAVHDTMLRFYRDHQPLEERLKHYQKGHREAAGTWEDMAVLGWLGLSVPESLEGFGASIGQCLSLIRLAGREARPESLPEHWLLVPLLLAQLEGAEASALATSFSMGTRRLGLLQAGGSVRLQVDQLLSGSGLLLGSDVAVTDWLVPVATDDAVWLAWVEPAAGGIEVKPGRLLDGRECRWVRFSQSPVRLVGTATDRLAEQALDLAAAAQVADAVGAFERAFDLTLEYVKQRTQFGQPLSSLQAVQHLMADVFCDLQQSISLMHRLGTELDRDPLAAGPIVAAAKSFIGRRMLRGVGRLIQVSGGIAMTEEYQLGHFYRRLQVASTVYGSADEHLKRIDPRALLISA